MILLSGQQASIALELQKELAVIRAMIKVQKRCKDEAMEEQLVKLGQPYCEI